MRFAGVIGALCGIYPYYVFWILVVANHYQVGSSVTSSTTGFIADTSMPGRPSIDFTGCGFQLGVWYAGYSLMD